MDELNFLTSIHTSTKRDYVQRVVEYDKADCAQIATEWGYDYWDGDRRYGFGGYTYDGRWRPVAEEIAAHYNLRAGQKILDIGCGKAFLLYEFTQVVPGIDVTGIDISEYGIHHAKEEIRKHLNTGSCVNLPYSADEFDFVYSLNTFHNLKNFELEAAVDEVNRVSKGPAYICVESYRNEQEKVNLLYWQLTCRSFYDTEEWHWLLTQHNYAGDVGFIFFE
ncbi:MAG: SAM-dependent methyltransferase [Rhodospirillaceae bacterium TMED167]|nr:SAM-dependent methyltransferase [Rhodospirillaceae bacterium]MDG2033485.1 class I SAM-dependent methyltransferase [Rhodospirillales bacterium]OUW30029.1 MAG: SAM-dependent methyltransferase [Rhodospirillaceae bacterium TMED167]